MIPRVAPDRLYGWIVVMNGSNTGTDHRITSWPVTIGRGSDCDVVLSDDSVSRVHGRLRRERRTTYFDDNSSANGSMRNGKPVTTSELRDGDLLKLGETWLLYKEAVPRERDA
jgi:pSer/pThr/pTyr-binding forkhead associated (FHA) protein